MVLFPTGVNPGSGASAEDGCRQLRYLVQPVDADEHQRDQRGQQRNDVREAQGADHTEHPDDDLREDEDESRGNDLIEAEADKCLEPSPEEPVHLRHDEPWDEDGTDEHTDRRGDIAVSNHGEDECLHDHQTTRTHGGIQAMQICLRPVVRCSHPACACRASR
jgi:hypothetical protein